MTSRSLRTHSTGNALTGHCHSLRSGSDIVVPSPLAITCNVMIPASRCPARFGDVPTILMSKATAMSIWVHPFRFRSSRTRFPI